MFLITDTARSAPYLNDVVETLVWVVTQESTGSPLVPVLEELIIIADSGKMKLYHFYLSLLIDIR